MKGIATIIVFAGLVGSSEATAQLFLDGPNDPIIMEAAQAVAVDPALLYAIAMVESGNVWTDGVRRPTPFVIRVGGKGIYAETRDELDQVWETAESRGDKIEDVGPLQVNLRIHGHRLNDPRDLMDPAINFRVGAQILREQLDANPDLVKAIGRYHHSTHEARTLWYAGKVLSTYREVIK